MTRWIFLLATAVPASMPAQPAIDASGARPLVLYFTHDDGPAAPVASLIGQGQSPTVTMANEHLKIGSPATFFHLGCKFQTATKQMPNPANSWCGAGWSDDGWVQAAETLLANGGFILANHTVDHIPLPWLEQNAAAVAQEVFSNEAILDTVRPGGDIRLFREPGFRGDSLLSAEIAADPRSANLYWPIGADIIDVNTCTNNSPDPQTPWNQGVDPVACGHRMAGQIAQQCIASGCIVLVHELDGSDFGDLELRQIFSDLGLDQPGSLYRADQITGIPGILPPTHLGPLQTLTAAFGDDDGIGQPLIGRVVASPLPSACKLRTGQTVWCVTPANAQGSASLPLQAPAPWLTIGDPGFDGRLWLADVNGDGWDDLLYVTPQGFWAALSNGQNAFLAPTLWLPAYVYQQSGVPQTVHFGKFYAKSKGQDLLIGFGAQAPAALYYNCGSGFGALFQRQVAWPATADLSTLSTADLNGDGLDDLVVRDPVNAQILAALNSSSGFAAFTPWMNFAGQTNRTGWNDPANGATLRPVSFGGKMMLTAGTSTGVIFAPVRFDPSTGEGEFSSAWRHLCNQCLTDNAVPSWHPEWQASGLSWLGNAVVFTRASGLEIAFGTAGN